MHNAQMIREGKDKEERFATLEEIAEHQLAIMQKARRNFRKFKNMKKEIAFFVIL